MNLVKSLIFCAAYFSSINISNCADDVCKELTPCSCEFSNGTGINLSPMDKTTFYSTQSYKVNDAGTQIELSTYYYHPCADAAISVNGTVNSSCNVPLSICRHDKILNRTVGTLDTYKMSLESYDFMGKTSDSTFSPNGDSIIYQNGPSSTIVKLVCAQSADTLSIFSLDEPNEIVLTFSSRSACLTQIATGRSIGSTLVIIFFSCVIFYLVLGICTKKFLMGATGIEVVPNLAFWSDLPNLVKDGWAFMIAGFKLPPRATGGAVRTPDPNSYDSI